MQYNKKGIKFEFVNIDSRISNPRKLLNFGNIKNQSESKNAVITLLSFKCQVNLWLLITIFTMIT